MIESRQTARLFIGRVEISFDGFNDTTAELFQIPEVRDYVQKLDELFPYWLYSPDKRTSSLDTIWRCIVPPHLTPEGKAKHFPLHLDPLLRNWWGPATAAIFEFIDATEREHSDLTDRYVLSSRASAATSRQ